MNAPRIARLSVAALVLLSGTALADLTGSYTAPNVTLTLTESQTKAGGHIDGTLRIADKEFPISGDVAGDSATGKLGSEGDALDCTLRSTDAGLELRSGGYIVQLARAGSSKPNPLSAIGESRGEPEVSSAVAARLPAVFTASLGFTLRHPAEWRERDVKGVGALVPDDAPQVQGQLGEMYALAAMPRGTLTASGLGQRLQSEMAAALPGMTQTGEAEMRNGGVTLRYQGPDSGGVRAASTVRATIKGDLIVVMMGLGAEEALRKHDSLAADVFATVGAAPRAIDQQLIGSWTNSSSYSSSTGGGGGFASSRTYTLAGDGTYRYSSQTVGGTSGVSVDSGESVESGIWAAKDGVFTKVDAAGNAVSLKYKFVDRHLVVYDAAGKRTIWDR